MRLYGAPSTSHVSSRMRLTGVEKATRAFALESPRTSASEIRHFLLTCSTRPRLEAIPLGHGQDSRDSKSPTLRLPQAPARHSVNRLHAIVCTGHVRLPSGVLAQPLASLEQPLPLLGGNFGLESLSVWAWGYVQKHHNFLDVPEVNLCILLSLKCWCGEQYVPTVSPDQHRRPAAFSTGSSRGD
jgi:hypothetical protein